MGIKVLHAGLLTTVQDLGRYGFQKYGIIVGGAMDTYALRVGNILLGNGRSEGGLEITLLGPELLFEEEAVIAITGGDLAPVIDGEAVPMWRPVRIPKGRILKFGGCRAGCRAYLSVAGGFLIPDIMGSKSTYLTAGLGGVEGRALLAGDVLALADDAGRTRFQSGELHSLASGAFAAARWSASCDYLPPTDPAMIRVTPGSQFAWFDQASQEKFFAEPFTVTSRSDRMGYRLEGAKLQLAEPRELISEAVGFGSVQVPPDGDPILLLADRQTAGGYAKIAQIIRVDLPAIAQLATGSSIRFRQISFAEAEGKYVAMEEGLCDLERSVARYLWQS